MFNKWKIFWISGWTPLDNGFPQTCQEKDKKDLAGELTTAAYITSYDDSSWTNCWTLHQCKSIEEPWIPPVRSKASSAAIWQWKDHSVHTLFLVLLLPRHMAAVILGNVLLQQFRALPGELVGPWVLRSISVLFFFALVSQLRVTQQCILLAAFI